MDDAKKTRLMADIMRAQHFEWRRAALAMAPDVEPMELVLKFWSEVGADTARFYASRIDPDGDPAEQVAQLIVASSIAMGEDAEYLGPADDGSHLVAHNRCPWFDWHRKEGLLAEDRAGCDHWLATTLAGINRVLGTDLRFETVDTLPDGASRCLRRLWTGDPET